MQQLSWAIQYESDRCGVRTIAYSIVLFNEGRMLDFDETGEDAPFSIARSSQRYLVQDGKEYIFFLKVIGRNEKTSLEIHE
jgi:hypothetical protein